MKKLSAIVALVFAVNFLTPVSPAHAANRCEFDEVKLVTAIQVSNNLSDITNWANAFRACLSSYADSLHFDTVSSNQQIVNMAGSVFYTIFTSAATYNMGLSTYPNARTIALKAAADYRMTLIDEVSAVNPTVGSISCDTAYNRLLAGALAKGDATSAANATQALRQCPLIGSSPRSTISITTSAISVGQTLTAVTSNWSTGSLSYLWYKNGNVLIGETSERYLVKPSDAGSRLSVRVTISYPGRTSFSKFSNISQTVTFLTPTPSPTPTVSVPSPTPTVSVPSPTPTEIVSPPPTPVINGTPRAGGRLTSYPASTSRWVLTGWDWLVDGQVSGTFRNNTVFLPTDKELGRQITIRVTWRRDYTVDLVMTSPAVLIQPSLNISPTPSPSPSEKATLDMVPLLEVSGKSLVLKTSSPNSTADSGLSLQKIWYRDGKVLPGISGSKYTPRSSDFGHKYYVEIIGKLAGSKTESRKSNEQTWGVQGNSSLIGGINSCRPKLAGALKVGSTVKVQVCVSFAGISIDYVWYRDSKKITNWPNGKYRKITAQDRGHTLSFVASYYGKGKDQYLEIASKDYFVK